MSVLFYLAHISFYPLQVSSPPHHHPNSPYPSPPLVRVSIISFIHSHILPIQFEPSFTATLSAGADFVTEDPSGDNIARPGVSALVQPDDGDTPFQVQISGIQVGTAEEEEIALTNTSRGLSVPYGSTYSGTFFFRFCLEKSWL